MIKPTSTLLLAALVVAAAVQLAHAVSQGSGPSSKDAAAGSQFQSIASMPGCSGSSSSSSRALTPELQGCSWKVQMQRLSAKWYAFEIPPDAADNMSIVIMARALSGQITMALWAPGTDPYRSVPTQVGTNYMEWPGLRELDQDAAAAGGGHASIASEQQYLFLSRKDDKPLLAGQYVVVIRADMGQPLVEVEVSTPSSMTQLIAEEQEALKQLVSTCCPSISNNKSTAEHSAPTASEQAANSISGWCSSVGRAVTYDLRQWYADICHVAPNVCDKAGHLQRLVLPPYALMCSEFPKSLAKFSRLTHLDLSYSTTPGSIADVAVVAGQLPALQQLHLRGVGLKGALSCELVTTGKQLRALSLSDNDNLAGSLPSCWLASPSLQELQLAGLSRLRGPLPELPSEVPAGTPGTSSGTSSSSESASGASSGASSGSSGARSDQAAPRRGLRVSGAGSSSSSSSSCGFGQLRYINMAGVIGDLEQGLTGPLPPTLASCSDLLYLDLSGHSLSGTLPALPQSIQFLNLSSNGLSSKLPNFAASRQLQYVDLSFNRFNGALQDMTVLPNLDWLDVSDNELTGGLPALPLSVRWVDLSNNRLDGELQLTHAPTQQQQQQQGKEQKEMLLVLLNLSNNKLSGPLSASLAAAPHLSFLDLSHNELSGTLEAFAAALQPKNQILQLNLSHNKLTGGIPGHLQILAAIRPVMVTMKDGVTPVHRIFDLSHNELRGTFPTWIITNLPLLTASCHCSVGISIDAEAFACPSAVPDLNRRAQEVLHNFEYLQCMLDMHTGHKQQQVPIWQLAGPSFTPYTREQHKQLLAQPQPATHAAGKSRGAIAAIVICSVAAAVLAAAAVMAMQQWQHRRRMEERSVGALLQHYDQYQPAGDAPLGSTPTFARIAAMLKHQGSSPTAAAAAGCSSSRSSQCGDGLCEIALVLTGVSGGAADAEGTNASSGKCLSKDGVV